MSPYQFIKKTLGETNGQALWRYRGQGLGQGICHVIGLAEPQEIVTCSMTHGWLGSPGDFLREFELVAA